MRTVAIIATCVAIGACTMTAAAHGFLLRWEDNPYGRHVMVGMSVVTLVLGVFLWVLMGWPGSHVAVAVVMVAVVVMAAWRLTLIVRRPHD